MLCISRNAAGRTDEALAYASPASIAKYQRCIVPAIQAVTRGRVLAARGEAAAAADALEWAAAEAVRMGMPLYELRALEALVSHAGGAHRSDS